MKRLTYVLTKDHTVSLGPHDSITLPQGSFVVPMDPRWVPKHIKESDAGRYILPSLESFVYTKYGILVVPKKIIGTTYD